MLDLWDLEQAREQVLSVQRGQVYFDGWEQIAHGAGADVGGGRAGPEGGWGEVGDEERERRWRLEGPGSDISSLCQTSSVS